MKKLQASTLSVPVIFRGKIGGTTDKILYVVLIIFIGFLAAVSYQFVTRRFEKLEQDDVRRQLTTVIKEFQARVGILESISVNWGTLDDTYEFVKDGNSEYLESKLNDESLKNLHINFMLFYNINGDLAHQKIVSPYPEIPEIDEPSLLSAVQSTPSLLYIKDSGSNVCGILVDKSSAYLIASHRITNGYLGNSIRGTYVVGRRLDTYEIGLIGDATQTHLSVTPLHYTGSTGDDHDDFHGRSSADIVVESRGPDTVVGYSKVVDLTGKHQLIIEIEVPRDVYQQGLVTWRQSSLIMIVLGGIFIVLLLLILDRSIFNRLSLLAQKVGHLSFTGENLDRLEVKNEDEIGKLAKSINKMLTELNRHHVALAESESKYRMFFEQDITGDALVTVDGKILDCNSAFAKILGYESIEEMKQVNVYTMHLSKSDRLKILDRVRQEKKLERIQIELVGRNKRPLYCIANVVGQFTPKGELTHVITYCFDETKRVLLENELRKAQKMKSIGTLAGGIAHDFNNLLQPILGYSNFLMADLPTDSPQRNHVEGIITASMRAKNLVQQILAFSRRAPHEMVTVRLQKILKDVVSLCRSTVPSNIEIHYDFQEECPPVIADPTQLHQVAMNLIINAYHAIDQTVGKISVQVKEVLLDEYHFKLSPLKPGKYALLSVSDTGCGMDDGTIEKIFEPYFTTKEQGKGTGLGLSVAYGIIKEHNGDINVYSELGKGTTFNVYLPVTEYVTQEAKSQKPELYQGGQERVLIVDDETIVLDILTNLMKRLGYKVTSFGNSTEALDVFKATPEAFDIIITDMTMPEITGDQLAEKVLEISPKMPIILCTGFSENISEEKARAIGFKDFLMKPFSMYEVSQKVRQVLDARSS